jgi:hypothetical protein
VLNINAITFINPPYVGNIPTHFGITLGAIVIIILRSVETPSHFSYFGPKGDVRKMQSIFVTSEARIL